MLASGPSMVVETLPLQITARKLSHMVKTVCLCMSADAICGCVGSRFLEEPPSSN